MSEQINKTQVFKMAKKYCKDPISKIPGYDEAMQSDEVYVIHHILELTMDGDRANTVEDLKRMGMYYNRPYFELVFLPTTEHSRIHNKGLNNFSFRIKDKVNQRRKLSQSLKGHFGWNKGKVWRMETRAKMRESHLGVKPSNEVLRHLNHVAEIRSKAYKEYKAHNGALMYNQWSKEIWPNIKGGLV